MDSIFDASLANTPGQLAIINGCIRMVKPQGYGAWPVIIPGENVEIFYKNQRITGPTVVDDVGDLQILAESIPAQSSFQLAVSPDQMVVTLIVAFKPGKEYQLMDAHFTRKLTVKAKLVREIPPEPIDPALILKELREKKISGQVDYEAIMHACKGLTDGEFIIVRGVPPQPPVDGRVEFVCDFTSRTISPESSERIDFRDRMQIAAD